MTENPFSEYLKSGDPAARHRASAWSTAVGFHDITRTSVSGFLLEGARRNIEGSLGFPELEAEVGAFHRESGNETCAREDLLTLRCAEELLKEEFSLTPEVLLGIHRGIFRGLSPEAGKYRTEDFSRKEWVLSDGVVKYGYTEGLPGYLSYDFSVEREVDYGQFTEDQIIRHVAYFIANLWQLHAFREGNTTVCTVFLIRYLKALSLYRDSDLFYRKSWYYRNALVRANYSDRRIAIFPSTEFLEMFLRSMICGEKQELRNRDMHLRAVGAGIHLPPEMGKKVSRLSEKIAVHPKLLYSRFHDRSFDLQDLREVTGLHKDRAEEISRILVDVGVLFSFEKENRLLFRFPEEESSVPGGSVLEGYE